MDNEAVLYEVDGAIATITLNRPKALNALNAELTQGMVESVQKAADDPGVRCVVLTSSSQNFMAGRDKMDEEVDSPNSMLFLKDGREAYISLEESAENTITSTVVVYHRS